MGSRLWFESRFVMEVFIVTSVDIAADRIEIMSIRPYA